MRAPLDDGLMAGFTNRLAEINELADRAPGFRWRLACEDDTATSVRVFGDDTLLVNLSVWSTLEDLRRFVYRTVHREMLRQRAEWFAPLTGHHLVLWAVPAGHQPAVAEACERLLMLRRDGPSPDAFTFASAPPQWRQ